MRLALACLFAVATTACALDDDAPYVDHDEASDYDPVSADDKADGLAARFDRQAIMTDAFFVDVDYLDAAALQAFFEATPYRTRSWLADATVGDQTAAEAIVAGARAHGVNPIVMVARMQVEKSLVSATRTPTASRVDYAFGCGCPDGRACSATYRGLDRQVECAAATLRRWFDASVDGTGEWRVGRARRTLDPTTVTPTNHATASLYAYTPWVLPNRGGNWLVWNVTRRYATFAEATGLATPTAPTE